MDRDPKAERDDDDESKTVEGSREQSQAAPTENEDAARHPPATSDATKDAPESGTRQQQ